MYCTVVQIEFVLLKEMKNQLKMIEYKIKGQNDFLESIADWINRQNTQTKMNQKHNYYCHAHVTNSTIKMLARKTSFV